MEERGERPGPHRAAFVSRGCPASLQAEDATVFRAAEEPGSQRASLASVKHPFKSCDRARQVQCSDLNLVALRISGSIYIAEIGFVNLPAMEFRLTLRCEATSQCYLHKGGGRLQKETCILPHFGLRKL